MSANRRSIIWLGVVLSMSVGCGDALVDTGSGGAAGEPGGGAGSGGNVAGGGNSGGGGNVGGGGGAGGNAGSVGGAGGTYVSEGALFASDWMHATGTSNEAISDGGKWNQVHGNTGSNPAVEVVSGGPGGLNMLRSWVRVIPDAGNPDRSASRWNQAGHSNFDWLTTADDVYWRFYVRVHPQDTFRYGNGHFVQDLNGDGEPGSQQCYWGVQSVVDGKWRSYLTSRVMRDVDPDICTFYNPSSPYAMDLGEWYRFEGHIKYFDHSREAKTHYELRIYDLNGNLIADTSDFGSCIGNLQEWYDNGNYWIINGQDPTWQQGFNGPGIRAPEGLSAPSDGISHDYVAFEMRDDRWVGPDPRIEP